MGLGNRSARQHETVAVRKAAVVSEDFADFNVGQRVMTVDGFPGVVGAIEDGPYPGTEAYRVTLDNGMGGGLYRTSDLQTINQTTASEHHTADQDYPELGDILTQRPDIAKYATLDGSIDPNRRVRMRSSSHEPDGAYFHGTRHVLRPGQMLTGGHARSNQGYGQPGKHVYYSGRQDVASLFAEASDGPDDDYDAKPHVYQIAPLHGHEPDPDEPDADSWRATHAKVVREVPYDHRGVQRLYSQGAGV
jgi:hypothetical protein